MQQASLLGRYGAAMQQLWGGEAWANHDVDNDAKLYLARQLCINNNQPLPISQAGTMVAHALGKAWLPSKERKAHGLPSLPEDPYFLVTGQKGFSDHCVALSTARLGELVQVMKHGEMQADGRQGAQYHPIRPGRPPCPRFTQQGRCMFKRLCLYDHSGNAVASQHGAAAGTSKTSAAPLPNPMAPSSVVSRRSEPDEEYPQNPGQPDCLPYTLVGYCELRGACRFHHPPLTAQQRELHAERKKEREPWDRATNDHGVGPHGLPLRPQAETCPFYAKHGTCGFGLVCIFNHPIKGYTPPPTQLQAPPNHQQPKAAQQQQQQQQEAAPVLQPPKSLLLGVLVDGIWPPAASKEAYLKGALAKHLIAVVAEGATQGVSQLQDNGETVYQMLLAQAGAYLRAQWQEQRLYNFEQKPYASLAELFRDEELWLVTNSGPKGAPCIQLRHTALLQAGAAAAAAAVAAAADAVWLPGGGREQWLCGTLAKMLFGMHFTPDRVAQVLATPKTERTVFRIHKAQAGERLREAWSTGSHPYEGAPWTHFAEVIAHQALLRVEPAPAAITHHASKHVVLDLAGLLNAAAKCQRATKSAADAAAAGKSPAAANQRQQQRRQQQLQQEEQDEEQAQEEDEEDEEEEQQEGDEGSSSSSSKGARAPRASSSNRLQAATSEPSSEAAEADTELQPGQMFEDLWRANHWGSAFDDQDEGDSAQQGPQAQASSSSANAAGGPVERWWPTNAAEHRGWAWAEACACVVAPESSEATQMVQHLELCEVLGFSCSMLGERIHMVQFFAPHVAVAGIQLPATAYLLDVAHHRAGAGTMALVKPILETGNVIKVCHGSRAWWRLLKQRWNISAWGHVDTQASHAAMCAMLAAATGKPPGNTTLSQAALLKNYGFWHPTRSLEHQAAKANKLYFNNKATWQHLAERPLTDSAITCAAADVALLIPLLEALMTDIQAASQQLLRSRRLADSPAYPSLASLSGARGTKLTEAVVKLLAGCGGGGESVMCLLRKWNKLGVVMTGPDGWDHTVTAQTA